MLKHIVVLGKDKKLCKALAEAAEKAGQDMEPIHVAPGEELPVAAVTVVAGPRMAEAAVDAAAMLGQRKEELLSFLARAIDCREDHVPGSSERVREHAERFAIALGLSPADRLSLERAALVRDIGKLSIPNELLLKDTLLTSDDWFLLRKHPHLGADLLAEGTVLRDCDSIVRYHHECYDGTGYPEGLEQEEIPYLARVMRILDVYCAMTSPRHYREGASTIEAARQHLEEESGKHFDPDLVKVFIEADVGRPIPKTA